MSIHSLADRIERNRAAADEVFVEIEGEIVAARDEIMASALRRLAKADPTATIEPLVDRLGTLWRDAWPFAQVRP